MFEFKNTDRPLRDIVRWCLYKQNNIMPVMPQEWKPL